MPAYLPIHYNENGSDCYLLLLDASKAFDLVEYVRLFRTISDRNMCPTVLRLLMNMYINQSFQVKWNNIISSQSHVSNGVKKNKLSNNVNFVETGFEWL